MQARWTFVSFHGALVERRLLRQDGLRQPIEAWIGKASERERAILVSSLAGQGAVRYARNLRLPVFVAAPGLLTILSGTAARGQILDLNIVPCGDRPGTAPDLRLGESLKDCSWCDDATMRRARGDLASLINLAILSRCPAAAVDRRSGGHLLVVHPPGATAGVASIELERAVLEARTRYPAAGRLDWPDPFALRQAGFALSSPADDPLTAIASADAVVTGSVRWAALARLLAIPVYPSASAFVGEGLAPEMLFAALSRDQIYLDPVKGKLSSFAKLSERLQFWREEELANDRATYCIGMNRWKRRTVAAFLGTSRRRPQFLRSSIQAAALAKANNGRVVIWASKVSEKHRRICGEAGAPLVLMEDGFLRSRGLGSHHVPPLSLVLDERGIYFDPSRPSDVEFLLQNADVPEELAVQANIFRRKLIDSRLSKYNVGDAYRIPRTDVGKAILVPGQVANDASVRLGAGAINTNWDLLAETRARNPDAFIIYKPHPDVELSHRPGFIAHRELLHLADYVASNLSSEAAIGQVDEVWTMTSLLGLEALLRDKKVVCFGLPFFAGWGLTKDEQQCPRRTRRRTLDELVAIAYFLYPRYIDARTGLRITAEDALELLSSPTQPPGWPQSWLRRLRYRT